MLALEIDDRSPYRSLIGVGGLGTGIFFALDGNHTLTRHESRPGQLLDVRDYCKLHIVIHYIAAMLGARPAGSPFQVVPVGRVGDDAAGKHVLDEMQKIGINTALVHEVRGKPTLFSVCFQYPDGTGGNITASNSAAADMSESDLGEAAEFLRVHGQRAIALAVPEVSLALRRTFLKLAGETRAFRAASFVEAEITEARDLRMFDMVDLVALNEAEAEAFAGVDFSPNARGAFVEKCCTLTGDVYRGMKILVSAGKHGAYAFEGGQFNFCPAPTVPVASTAGAGDALLGGVIAGLAAGLPLLKPGPVPQGVTDGSLATALEFGVLLASYKVSSPHTIHPRASLKDLLKFTQDVGAKFGPEVRQRFVELSSDVALPATSPQGEF